MGSRSPDRGPVVHSAGSWALRSVRSGAGTSSGSGGETGASWLLGLIGAALLVAYRFVPTYPPAHFGWVYAAAGGVFVILSVLSNRMRPGPRPGIALRLARGRGRASPSASASTRPRHDPRFPGMATKEFQATTRREALRHEFDTEIILDRSPQASYLQAHQRSLLESTDDWGSRSARYG